MIVWGSHDRLLKQNSPCLFALLHLLICYLSPCTLLSFPHHPRHFLHLSFPFSNLPHNQSLIDILLTWCRVARWFEWGASQSISFRCQSIHLIQWSIFLITPIYNPQTPGDLSADQTIGSVWLWSEHLTSVWPVWPPPIWPWSNTRHWPK